VRDYDVDNDGIVYDAEFISDNDTFFLPKSDILPPRECQLRHLKVPCPQNPIAVIEEEFGENWRTPIPGFKTYMIQRPSTAELRERAVRKAREARKAEDAAAAAAGTSQK
jgi:hypothetical protein